MAGTFFGLETASRALRMNQTVLDVIGHNVSNVNTPGYSRQTALIQATDPYRANTLGSPMVALGSGVELASILRVRNDYVEGRLNDSLAEQGRFKQLNENLSQVASAFNDPAGAGLNDTLTTFFNAFQDVARHPESTGPRTLVLHYSDEAAQRFRSMYGTLRDTRLNIADRVRGAVSKVNDLAKEIAGLNVEVQKAVSLGGQSNDLSDRRDALIAELTGLTGATVVIEQDGTGKKNGVVNVSVGGVPLVQGSSVQPLPTEFTSHNGETFLVSGSNEYPIRSGEVAGLIQADAHIQSYVDDLNELASTFIAKVNAQHSGGYGLDGQTGRALFTGTDATNIALNPVVAQDPSAIAAASPPPAGSTPAAGNGENAQAIANIAHDLLFGPMTLQERYAQTVARIGADVAGFESQADSQSQVVQQLTNLRNGISGVSMDEELTKMLAYQRAYQAAARLVTTYDDIIQNLLSVVGR